MSSARLLLRITTRSARHQILRYSSTASAPPPAPPNLSPSQTEAARPPPASTPPPPPPPPPRDSNLPSISTIVFTSIGLTIGYLIGSAIKANLLPPWYPPPGSDDDAIFLQRLGNEIDALDEVMRLRARAHETRSSATGVGVESLEKEGEDSKEQEVWREVLVDNMAEVESLVAAGEGVVAVQGRTLPEGRTLTQKSMKGSGLFGPQRVFWNEVSKELVVVLWLGGNVSGWPNITHGGAIATLLEEGVARAVVGPDVGIESIPEPSTLALTYTSPTHANNFYILRANIASPPPDPASPPVSSDPKPSRWFTFFSPTKDLTKQSQGDERVEVQATLERLNGKVCAKAVASWPKQHVQGVLRV